MSEYVFKLPDLGEGTVEAEIVQWHVKPGDRVSEGDVVADVMTDKANVEVPAPTSGTVLRTTGEPGDTVAVGAELIALALDEPTGKTTGEPRSPRPPSEDERRPRAARLQEPAAVDAADAATAPASEPPAPRVSPASDARPTAAEPARSADADPSKPHPPGRSAKVRTSPSIRRRAREARIDLTRISGTGPRGRILLRDLDAALAEQPVPCAPAPSAVDDVEEVKVIGLRRLVATRMQAAKREIPHFAYVEEVDVTALESLLRRLDATRSAERPKLTYLVFIATALIRALRDFPQCNAHFDAERGVLRRFGLVHLGVATQTPDGLKVPVVHDAGARSLWQLAAEIARVAEAARDNTASRQELTGSTITITSLGRLGGIASTPVINAPEVAIIGVNRATKRPVVVDDAIVVRVMMNLSSSFDHRFVDGFDAASLVQSIKSYLEEPATLFIP